MIFPTAATCFFLVRWEFALLSLWVLEIPQDSPTMVRDWACIQNIGLPLQEWLPNFQLLHHAALVLLPPLPHILEEIKGHVSAVLSTIDHNMLQRVWNELQYRIGVGCVTWEVLTEICEIMEITVIWFCYILVLTTCSYIT